MSLRSVKFDDMIYTVTKRIGLNQASAVLDELRLRETDECSLWPVKSGNYGKIWINGKCLNTHVVSCERSHGPRPSSLHEVAHSCRVPKCCNPRHLRWATRSENFSDKIIHGTDDHCDKNPMAKLTKENVREIRSSWPEWSKTMTMKEAGKRYGVNATTIHNVFHRISWRDLP